MKVLNKQAHIFFGFNRNLNKGSLYLMGKSTINNVYSVLLKLNWHENNFKLCEAWLNVGYTQWEHYTWKLNGPQYMSLESSLSNGFSGLHDATYKYIVVFPVHIIPYNEQMLYWGSLNCQGSLHMEVMSRIKWARE